MPTKFLVIGDVMLDVYENCKTLKISPEAPVPVLKVNETIIKLGGAANVALNLVKNYPEVTLIGLVGSDENATILNNLCEEANINTEFIIDSRYTTIVKKRIVAEKQQICRFDVEETLTYKKELEKDIYPILQKLDIDNNTFVLFSDYDKGFLTNNLINVLVSWSKEKGLYVSVDTKKQDLHPYNGVNIITPNLKEFSQIIGYDKNLKKTQNAKKIIQKYNLDSLLITMSEKGLLYIDNEQRLQSETVNRDAHDVTGAGDTVFAFWSICRASSFDIAKSLRYCNLAAAQTIQKIGTHAPLLSDVVFNLDCYVEDLESLEKFCKKMRNNGKIIVATNGCFDLFHSGHLDSLEFAANLGDVLIVGLNSDESVKELKGTERPIFPFKDRARIIKALKCVNFVVEIDTDPTYFYKAVCPNYLVKGSEYVGKTIIGSKFVENNGGSIVLFERKQEISTSKIINKVK